MLESVLVIALALAQSHLHISPWNGQDLPTTTSTAAKYRLTIDGKPGATVALEATGVARGWIAAFCDNRVCSPTRAHEKLPKSGEVIVQFELIREVDDAPRKSGATIRTDDGAWTSVPSASR